LVDTTNTVVNLSKGRSRVSNGSSLFVEADARSAWSRRFKDLVAIYAEHIGGNPTAPQSSLIRRIATLDCETEKMEGDLAEGKPVDIDCYNRLCGNLRRLLEQLGFEATKRDSAPAASLEEYLAAKRGEGA
jgi:hypothetical protein